MKLQLLTTVTILSILLSACSSDIDKSATLYQQETPLEMGINTPTKLMPNQESLIQVSLTQQEEKVSNADFVHFEIIKQDGNINYGMHEATNEGNGIYSKVVTFDSDGLYFLKIHAGNNGSIIMPTKQIIVGSLTENDKLFLRQNTSIPETTHEGHH